MTELLQLNGDMQSELEMVQDTATQVEATNSVAIAQAQQNLNAAEQMILEVTLQKVCLGEQ